MNHGTPGHGSGFGAGFGASGQPGASPGQTPGMAQGMAPGVPPGAAPPAVGPNEAMRFERLRAQDGQPVVPPPAVRPLVKGGGLNPQMEPQANDQWQAARDEMRSMPSFPAEERLFWIAWLLARHYASNGQRDRVPHLLQQTLPSLQQPRHQQVLLGFLARNAAAMGRMDEAMQIIPQLHTQSEDLQIDTSYRFTAGYVALLRNDPRTVLSVLGTNIDDVPISDAYDTVCGVYRVHAHEALGNYDIAKQQLMRIAASPSDLASVEQIIALVPQVPMCSRTLPAVKEAVTQLHANAIVTDSGIKVGRLVLVPVLGSFIAIGASGLASEVLEPPLSEWVPGAMIAVLVIGIMIVTFGAVLKGPAQRKRLMQIGVEGTAQLMVVQQTGTRVNDQPMLKLRMIVNLPGQPAYTAIHNEIVPQIRLAQVQPGTVLSVRVDPSDKRKMAIAWQ